MADELRIGLVELLRRAELQHDVHFPREGVRLLGQAAHGAGGDAAPQRRAPRTDAGAQ